MLFVLLSEFHTEDGVRHLGVGLGHLANVVQQASTLGQLGIQTQLRSHGSGQVGHLAAMLQQVLAVTGTVFHATHHAHQLMVHVQDAEVNAGTFTHLVDFLFNLATRLGHYLLNAGRVDAAVGDQLVERQACNLAAHGVETTDDDGVGAVVDDDFHAGEALQGADVAAFATDNATLHLFVLQIEDTHCVLYSSFGGSALYALDDNLLGLLGGGDLGLLDDVHDGGRSLGTGFLGHGVHQLLLGLVGAHAGDVLQLADALFINLLHLSLTFFQGLDLVVQVLADALELIAFLLQLVDLLVEALLALLQLVLLLADFLVLLVDALVVLALHLQILFFGL